MLRDADKAGDPAAGECAVDSEEDEVLSEAVRTRLLEMENAEPGAVLTGRELAQICVAKYGVGAPARWEQHAALRCLLARRAACSRERALYMQRTTWPSSRWSFEA